MPAKDRVVSVIDWPFTPLGHQTVTVTATAQTLAALLAAAGGAIAAVPAGTKLVYLQPRGDGVRYAHGDTVPATGAAGAGIDLFDGGQYPLRLADFASLKLVAAGSVALSVEFRG